MPQCRAAALAKPCVVPLPAHQCQTACITRTLKKGLLVYFRDTTCARAAVGYTVNIPGVAGGPLLCMLCCKLEALGQSETVSQRGSSLHGCMLCSPEQVCSHLHCLPVSDSNRIINSCCSKVCCQSIEPNSLCDRVKGVLQPLAFCLMPRVQHTSLHLGKDANTPSVSGNKSGYQHVLLQCTA